MTSIIKPMRPNTPAWSYMGIFPDQGFEAHRWSHRDGFHAISAVEVAEGGHKDEKIPHYHLSISRGAGHRCSSQDASFILKQFGMEDSLEDNHVPDGFVRNFWMPVAEDQRGAICPCNDSEPAIKLDKGDFVWRGI